MRSIWPNDASSGTHELDEYAPVLVTVDVVALTIRDGRLVALLIRRGDEPFLDYWALPGGFLRTFRDEFGRTRDEDLIDAARRELEEETGLEAVAGQLMETVRLEQLATYGTPGRDPRGRVITVAHLAFGPQLPDPHPGGDTSAAAWIEVSALGLSPARDDGRRVTQRADTAWPLAFDHAEILADGLERARSKLEYTPVATSFVGPEFTIPELRAVYEAVWDERLHPGNFHRKVTSVRGFVEDTGAATGRGGPRGGRRARLYRGGDARQLHPSLLRSQCKRQDR